jgi:hypothetical protein
MTSTSPSRPIVPYSHRHCIEKPAFHRACIAPHVPHPRGRRETIGRVHGKFFSITRPAATMVVIKQLLDPRWRIEIEADAHIPE